MELEAPTELVKRAEELMKIWNRNE
jgi:hypothetical protein